MRFYSGFSLRNEAHYFAPFLKRNDYTVAGFSYGAIKAFHDVLSTHERIDTLQLFSPAYFCNKPERFKRLQLQGYNRDSEQYRSRFIESCFAPYPVQPVEEGEASGEALEALLNFSWPESQLRALVDRGVHIEVYLGEKDAVIDADAAKAHFQPYATIYYIKNANHFVQGESA